MIFTPHYMYISGDQIEKNEMDWMCRTCGGKEKCVCDFDGKPGRRLKLRWEDNIKINLQEVEWEHELDWPGPPTP